MQRGPARRNSRAPKPDKAASAGESIPPRSRADREDMPLETKLLLACFAVLATALVLGVTRVLGAWADNHISRHDLIVESKRRRLAYFNAVAERENALAEAIDDELDDGSVIIEEPDEQPALAA